MGIGSSIGKSMLSKAPSLAPGAAVSVLRSVLTFAIDGVSALPGARKAASKSLENKEGDVEEAIDALVRNHIAMAGAQGFVTNIGGLVTLAVSVPTNISGVAVVQARMIAGIAHLRGYDLDDQRVRTAILACMLTESEVNSLVKAEKLPSSPMGIATAPVADNDLERTVATHVMDLLLGQVAGKKLPILVGKKIPLLGGGIGAGADTYSTWSVARYARKQFPTRRPH